MYSQKYSRQQYTLEQINGGPVKESHFKILISNITELAVEIVKNITLQNYHKITLCDGSNTNKTEMLNKILTNPKVNYIVTELTLNCIEQYDLVIFVDHTPTIIPKGPYIIVKTLGVTGQIFYNCIGENFKPIEKCDLYEELHSLYLANYDSNLDKFIENVQTYCKNININIINKFHKTYLYKLAPINSIIGSLVSQEVLKIANNILLLNKGYQYFEAFSCIQDNLILKNVENDRYGGQINIFGEEFQTKLKNSTCFIVGMGSIGNELFKNLLMMGVGNIVITDPKTITDANTGTHFLFGDNDIGKYKTDVSKLVAKDINKDVIVTGYQNYVNVKTEKLYDKKFYENITCVFGSVDNTDTRTYIDNRCVLFKTPFIDCGSDGFMGHTQVVIPYLTESYASINDPNEISYPLCAIASFPTIIEHCIIWAQEQLEEVFCKHVLIFEEYLKNPVDKEENREILLNIFNSIPNTRNGCYLIATKLLKKMYFDNIEELLNKFPPDYLLEDGTLFWAPPKKCPHTITFNDGVSQNFINIFTKLWMKTFIIPQNAYFPAVSEIPTDLSIYKNITFNIQQPNAKFVHYASILRAMNYDIEPINEFNSTKISEKIIPRLPSTSGLVAGLACLEFYKIIQKMDKIEDYKNSFVSFDNIIQSEPGTFNANGKYSLWDSFVVTNDEAPCVKDFIKLFETKYKINVTAIIYGSFMFYSTIFSNDKLTQRLEMNIVKLIETELKIKLEGTITLQIYDDNDDDEDLPSVLFMI